jgi:FixJ family two-component response regulator
MERAQPVVFVVDDDPSTRESLQDLLGSHGLRTIALRPLVDISHIRGPMFQAA